MKTGKPKDSEKDAHAPKDCNFDQPPDVDGGYAWVVLVATFFSFFISGGFLMTTGIIHTALLANFEKSVAKTAWVGSVFTAATSLLAPVGSMIVDRQSCRVAVMIGGSFITLGYLLTGFAPNIEFCIFSCGLIAGTGEGIMFSVLFVIMGFNFKKRLNLAQGLAASGTGLGMFILAPAFESSKVSFGYTGLFLIMAGLAMQTLIFGALMRPSTLEIKVKQKRKRKSQSVEHAQSEKLQSETAYRKALLDPFVILLSLSLFFYCGGLYALMLHWPNYCLIKGFSPMQSSYILSIVGGLSIFGRIFTGFVANIRCITDRMVYCGSIVIFGTTAIIFFLFSRSYVGHIVLAVIIGLTSGSPYVVVTSFTAEGAGIQFLAAAVGMEFLFGGVGSIVVPVISGYMLQAGLSYDILFVKCGLCLIISAVLAMGTKFVTKRVHDDVTRINEEINIPEKETLIDSKYSINIDPAIIVNKVHGNKH